MDETQEVLNRLTGRLNLYRIWQTQNDNYDTYDSAIVAAHDEDLKNNLFSNPIKLLTGSILVL